MIHRQMGIQYPEVPHLNANSRIPNEIIEKQIRNNRERGRKKKKKNERGKLE
jgi:hypothetical protein